MFSRRREYIRVLVLLVSVGIVIAYCLRHQSDLYIIRRLSVRDTALLFLLIASANAIGAYRLFVMLRWLGVRDLAFSKWIRIFAGSRLANYYVPQGTNVCRAIMLKKAYSFSYSESIAATVVLICFDVASVLFVTGLLVLGSSRFESSAGFLFLATGIAAVIPLVILPHVIDGLGQPDIPSASGRLAWAADRVRLFSKVLARGMQDIPTVAFLSAMTILAYLTALIGAGICLHAFADGISTLDTILLTTAFVLSRTVNIVPGNLGVSELLTGVSAGVLMNEPMYGVMISAIFRIVDFAVIGAVFLLSTVAAGFSAERKSSGGELKVAIAKLSIYLKRVRTKKIVPWVRGSVLDIGCGDAPILREIETQIESYCGVEVCPDLVEALRRQYTNHTFLCIDIDTDRIEPDHSFDTVLLVASIEHIYNQKHLFTEILQHLKQNGRIVITTPTPLGDLIHYWGTKINLFAKSAEDQHPIIFSKRRFRVFAKHFGLAIEKHQAFQLGCNQLVVLRRRAGSPRGPSAT